MTKILIKIRDYILKAKVELIILFAIIVLDLVTKQIVAATVPQLISGSGKYSTNHEIPLIPNFLYITYSKNTRAAFGSAFGLEKIFGESGVMIFFIIFTFIAVAVFAYFMYRERGRHTLIRVALALIIGGAIGNLVDRMALSYVRDWISIKYFGLTLFDSQYFPTFNIADAGLVVGVICFVVYYLFIYDKYTKSLAKAGKDDTQQDDGNDIKDIDTSNIENDNNGIDVDNYDKNITVKETKNDEKNSDSNS